MDKISIESLKARLLSGKRPAIKHRRLFSEKTYIDGFTQIHNAIICDPKLSCEAYRILSVIIFHNMKNSTCWPSYETISEETGLSRMSVYRHLKELFKLHYLSWKRTGKSNIYSLGSGVVVPKR